MAARLPAKPTIKSFIACFAGTLIGEELFDFPRVFDLLLVIAPLPFGHRLAQLHQARH